MRAIKSFLRKIDVFGVPYSFKHQEQEKYTTALGGFFVFLFICAALFMAIYYFIPFYNRKNFTTVYYTLTMSQTEQVSFSRSKTVFSVGLNCYDGSDGTKATDLLKVNHYYVIKALQPDNKYKKTFVNLNAHTCTKADFFNEYDETFDGSEIARYQCLEDYSNSMEGIFTSPLFCYYQFEVVAKNSSKELLDKIEDYLQGNDCKLQFYYIDNTIDIDDYENPVKSYIEANFIQLNPTLSPRRNIYFMNQYLFDDNLLMWVSGDEVEANSVKTLYSRYEEYSMFMGLNRTNTTNDLLNYAKVFIRADTKRIDVKRRYQKFMEFYADASSLLVAVYDILIIIFNYINNFWAEQSLAKKVFFFKDLDNNNLNLNKNYDKIQELLDITEINLNKGKIEENRKEINDVDNKNSKTNSKKNSDNISYIENDDVNIYNTKKIKNNPKNKYNNKLGKFEEKKVSNKKGNEDYGHNNYDDQLNSNLGSNVDSNDNFRYNMNMRNKNRRKYFYKSSDVNESDMQSNNSIIIEDKKNKRLEYEFNIFEVIGALFCKCCLSRNLKRKSDLNEKANKHLYNKMEISVYIRNTMLFDIINETFIDSEHIDIINFLCRPIISLKNKEKNELSLFYRNYKENDFNKCYTEIIQLMNKSGKRDEENKLISLSNKHLKKLIN